jgi:hypothetical protein
MSTSVAVASKRRADMFQSTLCLALFGAAYVFIASFVIF